MQAQAEKIDIPDELRILNPESQKKPVVIGTEAYMIYPLTEGQAERVSKLLSDVIIDITTLDVKCPNCNYVFHNMLGRKETCNRCKGGHQLISMQKPPVEALTHEDRVPKLIEELVGIEVADVKSSLTINQGKHIAGILYVQNFMEEDGGGLPEESKKNFKALMNWISPEEKRKEKKDTVAVSEKSTKPLPMNTDLPENISKEDGKQGEEVEEDDL